MTALGFLLVDGAGEGTLEDVFVGLGDGLEDFRIDLEVLPQDRLGGVR